MNMSKIMNQSPKYYTIVIKDEKNIKPCKSPI
jgi:hypothetical protein